MENKNIVNIKSKTFLFVFTSLILLFTILYYSSIFFVDEQEIFSTAENIIITLFIVFIIFFISMFNFNRLEMSFISGSISYVNDEMLKQRTMIDGLYDYMEHMHNDISDSNTENSEILIDLSIKIDKLRSVIDAKRFNVEKDKKMD